MIAIEQFRHIFDEIPFNRILGLKLDTVASDHVLLSFTMKNELIGNFMHGILHGGVISSVLDMAGGTAAMISAIYKNKELSLEALAAKLGKSSTVNLNIDFIQPGRGNQFTAKAWVQHSGSRITFARMELHNHEGVLIASGSGTYHVS